MLRWHLGELFSGNCQGNVREIFWENIWGCLGIFWMDYSRGNVRRIRWQWECLESNAWEFVLTNFLEDFFLRRKLSCELFGVNVRHPVQDYKALCAVVMISASRVNTQTHRKTDRQTDRQMFSTVLSIIELTQLS